MCVGIEGQFYWSRRCRMGGDHLFTTMDVADGHDPSLRRIVIISTDGAYATIPSIFGEDYVVALDMHQVPVMGGTSTLAPIHGLKRQCAYYLVEMALNFMVRNHGLRPVDVSVHRIGDLGEVPLEPCPGVVRGKQLFLHERGVQIAPDDHVLRQLPFMAAVQRAAAAGITAPTFPGSQARGCFSNIDIRAHFTGIPGEATLLLRKGDAFRGDTGRCHHYIQLGIDLARARQQNIPDSELARWLSANERSYGGSATVYLRPLVTSKSGVKGENQSSPPPGFAPNTFCAYHHNSKVKALDIAPCVGATQRTVGCLKRPTNGQAAAALKETIRLLGDGLHDGIESVDFELNCTIGSHLEGADARMLLSGVVQELSDVLLSGAVELHANIPRKAIRSSVELICARLQESRIFSGRKGSSLSEVGVDAWYAFLSNLGITVEFSSEGRRQQGLVLTHGPAAGTLRFLRGLGVPKTMSVFFRFPARASNVRS